MEREVPRQVRGYQAQTVRRELQHERQFIVPPSCASRKMVGNGSGCNRSLNTVGEAYFSGFPAHPGKREFAQEPVEPQGKERLAQPGGTKCQQEQQGAAQSFDLARKAVNEDLLLDNEIDELRAPPAGFDAGHFPGSTFREQVLEVPMCTGIRGQSNACANRAITGRLNCENDSSMPVVTGSRSSCAHNITAMLAVSWQRLHPRPPAL